MNFSKTYITSNSRYEQYDGFREQVHPIEQVEKHSNLEALFSSKVNIAKLPGSERSPNGYWVCG